MVSISRYAVLPLALFATCPASASVEISAKPTSNMTCSGGVCSPTAKTAVLNVNDLTSMLASGDVTVTSGSQAKDIEIDADLGWTNASRLTLDSYRSVAFSRPVEITGTGALTIATNDGGSHGDFQFSGKGHVEFWSLKSNLLINGKAYRLVDSIKTLNRALRHTDGSGLYFALMRDRKSRASYAAAPVASFGGTFEGLGNTISGLTVTGSDGNLGLFEALELFAVVRDLSLKDANVSGTSDGAQFVGILTGASGGIIVRCSTTGHASAIGAGSSVGGLVARNSWSISQSSSTASVSDTGSAASVGGLAGQNFFITGTLGAVDQSFATGKVTGGDGAMTGGLIGYVFGGVITNSYATGSVLGGSNSFAGGLLGNSADGSAQESSPIVSGSYSTGSVSGGSGTVIGGLIGQDAADARNTNNYWDMDTSGVNNPAQGAGNIQNDPGTTGLSDAQLKSGLPAGFDKRLWKEKADINAGYPYLIANPPPE